MRRGAFDALRLMPNWELAVCGRTLLPNPVFGGLLFPGIVFGFLYALPAIDRAVSIERAVSMHEHAEHHLLDRLALRRADAHPLRAVDAELMPPPRTDDALTTGAKGG
jgi:hypothetical protein